MKYKLTKNKKIINGVTLYQIQALKNFGNVKKGELGGGIEKEDNLSQEGNCWVSGNACVFDNARVYGDARVSDNARVSGNARIYGNACVSGNARVYGDADVRGLDEISSKKHIICITNFKYPITITPMSVHIGCQDFEITDLDLESHEEFDDFTFNTIKSIIMLGLEQIYKNLSEE